MEREIKYGVLGLLKIKEIYHVVITSESWENEVLGQEESIKFDLLKSATVNSNLFTINVKLKDMMEWREELLINVLQKNLLFKMQFITIYLLNEDKRTLVMNLLREVTYNDIVNRVEDLLLGNFMKFCWKKGSVLAVMRLKNKQFYQQIDTTIDILIECRLASYLSSEQSNGEELREKIKATAITITETATESGATLGIESAAQALGQAAAGVFVTVVVDVALTSHCVYKAKKAKDQGLINAKQFKTQVKKKVCESGFQFIGGTTGSVVGQLLIPVPGVGAFVGGLCGSLIGTGIGKGVNYGLFDQSINEDAEIDDTTSFNLIVRVLEEIKARNPKFIIVYDEKSKKFEVAKVDDIAKRNSTLLKSKDERSRTPSPIRFLFGGKESSNKFDFSRDAQSEPGKRETGRTTQAFRSKMWKRGKRTKALSSQATVDSCVEENKATTFEALNNRTMDNKAIDNRMIENEVKETSSIKSSAELKSKKAFNKLRTIFKFQNIKKKAAERTSEKCEADVDTVRNSNLVVNFEKIAGYNRDINLNKGILERQQELDASDCETEDSEFEMDFSRADRKKKVVEENAGLKWQSFNSRESMQQNVSHFGEEAASCGLEKLEAREEVGVQSQDTPGERSEKNFLTNASAITGKIASIWRRKASKTKLEDEANEATNSDDLFVKREDGGRHQEVASLQKEVVTPQKEIRPQEGIIQRRTNPEVKVQQSKPQESAYLHARSTATDNTEDENHTSKAKDGNEADGKTNVKRFISKWKTKTMEKLNFDYDSAIDDGKGSPRGQKSPREQKSPRGSSLFNKGGFFDNITDRSKSRTPSPGHEPVSPNAYSKESLPGLRNGQEKRDSSETGQPAEELNVLMKIHKIIQEKATSPKIEPNQRYPINEVIVEVEKGSYVGEGVVITDYDQMAKDFNQSEQRELSVISRIQKMIQEKAANLTTSSEQRLTDESDINAPVGISRDYEKDWPNTDKERATFKGEDRMTQEPSVSDRVENTSEGKADLRSEPIAYQEVSSKNYESSGKGDRVRIQPEVPESVASNTKQPNFLTRVHRLLQDSMNDNDEILTEDRQQSSKTEKRWSNEVDEPVEVGTEKEEPTVIMRIQQLIQGTNIGTESEEGSKGEEDVSSNETKSCSPEEEDIVTSDFEEEVEPNVLMRIQTFVRETAGLVREDSKNSETGNGEKQEAEGTNRAKKNSQTFTNAHSAYTEKFDGILDQSEQELVKEEVREEEIKETRPRSESGFTALLGKLTRATGDNKPAFDEDLELSGADSKKDEERICAESQDKDTGFKSFQSSASLKWAKLGDMLKINKGTKSPSKDVHKGVEEGVQLRAESMSKNANNGAEQEVKLRSKSLSNGKETECSDKKNNNVSSDAKETRGEHGRQGHKRGDSGGYDKGASNGKEWMGVMDYEKRRTESRAASASPKPTKEEEKTVKHTFFSMITRNVEKVRDTIQGQQNSE